VLPEQTAEQSSHETDTDTVDTVQMFRPHMDGYAAARHALSGAKGRDTV